MNSLSNKNAKAGNKMRGSPARIDATRLTLIAFGLFLVIPCVLLSSEEGSRDYRAAQNGLLGGLLIFAALFVTRLAWRFGAAAKHRGRRESYVRSGALAIDMAFLTVAVLFLLLGDFSYWKDYTIRIGTVAAIAIVRLVVLAIESLRFHKTGGSGT